MEYKDRTLLIVEDDNEYNEVFKEYCDSALKTISQEFAVRGTVDQAYNFEDAQQILNSGRRLDFVSLDLVLTKGGAEASGMQLLRELRDKNKRTIAIVVSGEMNPKHSIEALQKLGVLAYVFKADVNEDTYQHTVQAALRYLEVEDCVMELEQHSEPDPVVLETAEEQWKKVLVEMDRADISRRQLPQDLGPRLTSLRNKLLDPNTELPIGKLLQTSLMQRVLNHDTLWSLLHIKIKNYSMFEANYPGQVRDLFKAIANILNGVSKPYSEANPVVGLMDKHPAIGPSFLIILKEDSDDLAHKLRGDIIQEFSSLSKSFVSETDIRIGAKQKAKKAIQEEKYKSLSESERDTKKSELTAEYVEQTISLLAPKLDIEVFSSEGLLIGDMVELVDTLASTNSSLG